MKSTAVLVDLVGYSDMSRLLEDSLGVQATLSLNQQVQRLILPHLPRLARWLGVAPRIAQLNA